MTNAYLTIGPTRCKNGQPGTELENMFISQLPLLMFRIVARS
jgi:hypothetical protein